MNLMNPVNPRKSPITAAWALSLALLSSAALAQPDPGDIGVFADEAGTQSYLFVESFAASDFYVVAFDLDSPIHAMEFGISFNGLASEELSVSLVYLMGSSTDFGPGPLNVIHLFSNCADGSGSLVLAKYHARIFVSPVPTEIAVTIGASSPSSFDPPAPGWASCDPFGKTPFGAAQNGLGHYPDASLIINPPDADGDGVPDGIVPVATEETRFGEIKSRF